MRQLRILLADGRLEHLARVEAVVVRLGHVVVARETSLEAVASLTEREAPDVAIVIVSDSSEHSLEMISKLVREAICPVIALLDVEDPAFIREAAKRGVFAYLTNGDGQDDQFESAIDVVLARFAEYHDLQGAFGRRALTERAKGILMERHSIDEEAAFAMLRDHSRHSGRKLVDIAQAILDSHSMLPSEGRLQAGQAE
jgi:AmiR/NasT family two-component response regulator